MTSHPAGGQSRHLFALVISYLYHECLHLMRLMIVFFLWCESECLKSFNDAQNIYLIPL